MIVGRRGPAQAAFTNPELRELGELTDADVIVDPEDVKLDSHSARSIEGEGDLTPAQERRDPDRTTRSSSPRASPRG